MARSESTPLQTPEQIGDVYEQVRRLQQTLAGAGLPTVVTSTTRPSNPVVGDNIYERDTSSLLTWDGFAWRLPWNMPWGRVVDVKITSPINGLPANIVSPLGSLSAAWVAVSGRRYEIDVSVPVGKHSDAPWTVAYLVINGTTVAQAADGMSDNESSTLVINGFEFIASSSATVTIGVSTNTQAGTYDVQAAPPAPAWIHVDDIGPAVPQSAPLPQSVASGPPSGQLAVVVTTPTPTTTLTAGSPVTVGAGAQPDPGQTVTQVQFLVDGQSIGTDTTAPYLATWSTPSAGAHALTARVTQSDGKTAVSGTVSVVVATGSGTGGGGTGGGTGGGGTGGGTGGTAVAAKLTVSGKVLKDSTGATVTLRGVNQYVVPAWNDPTGVMGALTSWMDSNFGRVCDDLLTKGVNLVRIPIMYDPNTAYTQRIVNAVNVLKARGMYALLTPADDTTFGSWPSSTPTGSGGGTAATVPTFGASLTHASFNASTFSGAGTNYTFTVDQPTAGRTVFAYVTNIQAGATAVTPTVAGLGMAWTQRATVSRTAGGNTIRVTLFTGTGNPAAAAFQVTNTAAQLGCGIQVAEFSNVDPTTPVVTQPSNGNGATVTLLPATAPTSGLVWMGVSRLLQERQTDVGTFIGIDADWLGSPAAADVTAYNAANSTSGVVHYPTAADWVGIFAEVRPAPTASGGTGSQNDVAVSAAQFLQMMWNASGKSPNVMLEVWDEPVGTTLTAAQWQSGMQAGIAVLRSGTAAYDGPIFCTGRNWGWAFDSAQATAIKAADPNVVFSAHRFAVQSPTAAPVGSADVSSFQSIFLNAASAAGVAAFVGSWGIYNGGWGTGGSKTANTQGWAVPMAAAIQSAAQGGTCVGEAAWMWLYGGQVPGEDDENSMEDPLWSQVVAGTAWTPNIWGTTVFQLTTALAPAGGGGVTPPPPGPTVTADNWEMEVSGTKFIDKQGAPLILRGIAQYMVEYTSGGSGAATLYSWFATNIVAVATDWQQKGVNFVRIPITYNTGGTYINDLKLKVDTLWAHGIRSAICAFDGSWGAYNSNTAPDQMAQVWGLIGSPRYCGIETNNEPNGITAAQWQGGMQNWVTRLRAAGYKGPVFCGSFGFSWSFDLPASQAIRDGDANTGGHPGNVCIVNHRYAVTDPSQAVQPANDGTANWKPLWPDQAGPGNIAFITNEWGPWNGAPCSAFGIGGSYASNVDGWGENMRQEIQNAVAAGHMAGAMGWMWAWSDPNGMTGPDAPCAYPVYVQSTSGPPWTLNRWGAKMFSMVQALAGSPTGAGPPGANIGGPSTATAGAAVSFSSVVTTGGSNVTISKVDFIVDGVVVSTDTASPYNGTWTATIGTHTVTARATQSDGQVGTSGPWTVTVASAGGGGGGTGGVAPLDSWQFEVNGTSFKDVAGNQIVLRGIAQYLVTGSGDDALTNWFTSHIAAVAADWKAHGVNFCRIPIPNNTSTSAINELKAKVDALWAQGIYSCICAFFGFSGLSSSTPDADTMFTIWQGIGSPRYCAIETNNEPNGMDAPTWQGGIDRWRTRLRALGYKGPIFCGARDWSWTYDSTQSKAIRGNDTNPGGHPGNTCIVCHRYAVTDPANPVEPANDGTVNWKPQWPDTAGPDGVAFIIDEWGPWNGGSISPGAYGTGGSYSFNVNSWGATMKTEIVNAVTAGHMAGATGWMWAWSDPNTMTDANPESGSTGYVQGTSGPPWTLNAWGTLNFAMVSSLAAGQGVAGSPTATHSAPTSATPGTSVTVTATATPGGTGVTITSTALLIDGASVATDTTSPYSLVWTSATAGTHTIQVQATQSDGKTGLSAQTSISVTSTPPSGGAGLLHVSGKSIKDGSNNTVFLRGLNQYAATPYWDSGSTYTAQYLSNWFDANMARVAAAWYADGVRHLRMPVNCADNSTSYKDSVKRITAATMSAGIYVSLNGFGGLGNYPSNAGNIGTYLVNLWNYIGKPAMCMINQWNEPHDGGWLGGTQAARSAIRAGGYTGIIFMDTEGYATQYDPPSFNTILSNDSAFGGNIAFSTHRYHALCSNSSYPAGYLPDNWCSQNWPGTFLSGAYCVVVGEYGFHNCYNQRDQGGGGTNWINFLNDATNTIIAGKNNGNCAGAWAWMWTWDENSLVDPSQFNISQGAAWTYNTWGQIAKRMWANTAQGI